MVGWIFSELRIWGLGCGVVVLELGCGVEGLGVWLGEFSERGLGDCKERVGGWVVVRRWWGVGWL